MSAPPMPATGRTLQSIVEHAAKCFPDRVALEMDTDDCAGDKLTYSELLARSRAVALALNEQKAPAVVGLMAHRSCEMLMAMLGILISGRAYCPFEPDTPAQRISQMLETAKLSVVLIPTAQLASMSTAHPGALDAFGAECSLLTLCLDGTVTTYARMWSSVRHTAETKINKVVEAATATFDAVSDGATAYVLFTSGSTGRPKGCMVPHRGTYNYAVCLQDNCNLAQAREEAWRFCFKTPYVFDVSLQDIYTCFAAGCTLVIAQPDGHKDPEYLVKLAVRQRLQVMCFVPTMLTEFTNHLSGLSDALRSKIMLHRIFTIGEALLAPTCEQVFALLPKTELHNLYGPTECSVGVSHFHVTKESLGQSTVAPIGKVLPYVTFMCFDHTKYEPNTALNLDTLQQTEELGELFIGGDCIAQGYINDPEKTAAAFGNFPSLLAPVEGSASPFTLYRSGDLVKKRPDGVWDYFGRTDFQVKINGVRIECEEVAAAVRHHPGVEDAFVYPFDAPSGGQALACWVAMHKTEAAPEEASEEADEEKRKAEEGRVDDWGNVYDEMYAANDGVADPTTNWSGYTDSYTREVHTEPVIREWVEWSVEQVLRHAPVKGDILEIGCGNGMLLFRIAPQQVEGEFIGTDVSKQALNYVHQVQKDIPQYTGLNVRTAQVGSHEILQVTKPRSAQYVLCNGVTMYYPSAQYLVETVKLGIEALRDGGVYILGDVQSRQHQLQLQADVETYKLMQLKPDALASEAFRNAARAAHDDQLSYYEPDMFLRLARAPELLGDRVAHMAVKIKRGYWHSEFNRFRYDAEFHVGSETAPKLNSHFSLPWSHVAASLNLHTENDTHPFGAKDVPNEDASFVAWADNLPAQGLTERVSSWLSGFLEHLESSPVDAIRVSMPNARLVRPHSVLCWLRLKADDAEARLEDMPQWMRPSAAVNAAEPDMEQLGVEPEGLHDRFAASKVGKAGIWKLHIFWSIAHPALMEVIAVRASKDAANWMELLSTVEECPPLTSAGEANQYRNCAAMYREVLQAASASNDAHTNQPALDMGETRKLNSDLRAFVDTTALLKPMHPAIYVPVTHFPKNTAGKLDRKALPSASELVKSLAASGRNAENFDPCATKAEEEMAQLFAQVLQIAGGAVDVSATTPFIDLGGHSLTGLQLAARVHRLHPEAAKPTLPFIMSPDCTVRNMCAKVGVGSGEVIEEPKEKPWILNLGVKKNAKKTDVGVSPNVKARVLVLGAAGTAAHSYKAVADQLGPSTELHVLELPGHGTRLEEELEYDFDTLFSLLEPHATKFGQESEALGLQVGLYGDSLGAVIAYELAAHWQREKLVHTRCLFVSSNASPMRASRECAMGNDVLESLGLPKDTKVTDLQPHHWEQFLVQSSDVTKEDFHDAETALHLLRPLIADCTCYESYKLKTPTLLQCPVVAFRGEDDPILAHDTLRTWDAVVMPSRRTRYVEFPGIGHDVRSKIPREIACLFERSLEKSPPAWLLALPDFSDYLRHFGMYRDGYSNWRRKESKGARGEPANETMSGCNRGERSNVYCSPFIGAMATNMMPPALALDPFHETTPQDAVPTTVGAAATLSVLRQGNASWRTKKEKQ